MCVPSVVADDWIIKGCHIHVNGIELALHPNHTGGAVFSSVFSSPADTVQAAIHRKVFIEKFGNAISRADFIGVGGDGVNTTRAQVGGVRTA